MDDSVVRVKDEQVVGRDAAVSAAGLLVDEVVGTLEEGWEGGAHWRDTAADDFAAAAAAAAAAECATEEGGGAGGDGEGEGEFWVDYTDPGDGKGRLPTGWEWRRGGEDRYYLDRNTETTQWEDPRLRSKVRGVEGRRATGCKAFMDGFCPMGEDCMFSHVTAEEADRLGVQLDEDPVLHGVRDLPSFQASVARHHMDKKARSKQEGWGGSDDESGPAERATPPPLDGGGDSVADLLGGAGGASWRLAVKADSFKAGELVQVPSVQQSNEEYLATQRKYLGTKAVVETEVPGNLYVSVIHGPLLSEPGSPQEKLLRWRKQDLLVERGAPPPAAPVRAPAQHSKPNRTVRRAREAQAAAARAAKGARAEPYPRRAGKGDRGGRDGGGGGGGRGGSVPPGGVQGGGDATRARGTRGAPSRW